MTTSIASKDPWPTGSAATLEPGIGARATPRRDTPWRTTLGMLDDAVLLLIIALLFPVVILLAGMPLALVIRLVTAMLPRG